jgi:hypothetical protein
LASPAKCIGGINQALWKALHRGKVSFADAVYIAVVHFCGAAFHLISVAM